MLTMYFINPIKTLHVALIVLWYLLSTVKALSPKFLACQLQKPAHMSALVGCPSGTVYVSASDGAAHFKTVQEAIEALSVCFR